MGASRETTSLQLITFLDECVKTLARGDTVDTVYLDFIKAFDGSSVGYPIS